DAPLHPTRAKKVAVNRRKRIRMDESLRGKQLVKKQWTVDGAAFSSPPTVHHLPSTVLRDQKLGMTSPLAMVARSWKIFMSMRLLIPWTEPSQNTKLMTAVCGLPQPYLHRLAVSGCSATQAS